MKLIEDIINNVWFQRIFWSIIVTLVAVFIYHLVAKFLSSKEKKNSRVFQNKKNKTFIRMLKSIVAYGLGVFTFLVILQIFGINVSSMLAGVGIASIIIGFALQDAMKDIFRGLDILSDGYYDIGDVIKYENNMGQVLSISLRTTKIQDINTNNIVSIANRNIVEVEVDNGYIYLPVPLPYELPTDKAEAVMKKIAKVVAGDELVKTCDYQGLTEIADSTLNHQLVITCDPMDRLQARRNALGLVVKTLEANKISIPYNQLDVHPKK